MKVVINSLDSSNIQGTPSEQDVVFNFLVALGYDPADPPLGDLLKSHHGLQGDWVIVSPIHWEASHNGAQIVAANKDLLLSEVEAKTSYQLYADYLALDGLKLYYHSPELWLLHGENLPPLKAKPVHQLINKSFMAAMQGIDNTMYWQKFLTESQMFFGSDSNKTPINGVWLWGSAKLKKQSQDICADKTFYPLAKVCKTEVTEYSPSLCLKKYSLLLLNSLNSLSLKHQKELNKLSVTWIWNNKTYKTTPNYLIRLWRHLIHAH